MNALKITRSRISRRSGQIVLTGALLLGTSTLGGCETAGEGLFTGAALGALVGLTLGSLDGNAGEGAIAGTIIGAAGGAIIGDANRHDREYGSRDHRYERRDRRGGHHQSGYGYSSHGHSSHGHYSTSWWEEDWCD